MGVEVIEDRSAGVGRGVLRRVAARLVGPGTAAGMSIGLVLGVGVVQTVGLATAPVAAAAPSRPAATSSTSAAGAKKVHLPKRCTVKGRVLCADKTKRKLYFVQNGRILKTVDARFGCSGARHTREGTFKVYRKNRHWVSTIYHTSMPFSMFFSGGQAVHYSSDFAARGYLGCSHGCVNVRAWSKLEWMFDRVRVGDRVVVYRS